jgi:hypothetical protein
VVTNQKKIFHRKNNIINNIINMSSSDLIVKATLGDETRRFRIAGAAISFAELARNLGEMFASHAPFKTAYLDADGDLVTFSSENEFRDAIAQRADNATPFKVLIVPANGNNNNVAAAELNKKNSASKVPNVWLDLPIWVRHRVMAFNRLEGDVNDAAQFDKLSAQAQERVHSRFVAKLEKKEKKFAAAAAATTTHLHAPSIVPIMMPGAAAGAEDAAPVVELKDEELWAAVPLWLQQRVVSKFVPHLTPQASEFNSFVALPEHAKFSVRNRAAHIINKRNKFARKYGPHPPATAPPAETVAAAAAAAAAQHSAMSSAAIDEAADRALWDTLPPWVQLKVAARAAHSGEVPPNPRDFATFQMLPPHVQAKLRTKGGRGKFHGKCW